MAEDVPRHQTLPLGDWTLAGDRSHIVQFYDDDQRLVDLLARFVGSALVSGESAVVIATADHRRRVAETLQARGFDVAVPRRQRRYTPVDAAGVVARVTGRRGFDADRFGRLMGRLVDRSARAASRGRVAVFGEAVALLWSSGRREAALRVEKTWNDVARNRAFALCCAYPMRHFGADEHAAPFLHICAQHSHVFSAGV